MATDARVRYTKMVIEQSFIRLLKDKPINRITVKEICELSQINRATFYKHYLDVYDLLSRIESRFLEELKSVLSHRKDTTTKDVLTIIMVSLKAEEDTYKALCSANGDSEFPAKVFDVCYQISGQQDFKTKGLSAIQKEWLYQFTAHGCNGILVRWISDGMKEPISEVADYAQRLMNNTMTGL